jgi:hypothetical protein
MILMTKMATLLLSLEVDLGAFRLSLTEGLTDSTIETKQVGQQTRGVSIPCLLSVSIEMRIKPMI